MQRIGAAHSFKVALCGRSGVGKTTLWHAMLDPDECSAAATMAPHPSTIGTDVRPLTVGDTQLTLWDTAGQERFGAVTRLVYRNAHAVIFVYDVCDRASFDAAIDVLAPAIDGARTADGRAPWVIVVGNKADLPGERRVPTDEAAALARRHVYSFMETSAKTRDNVRQLVHLLADTLVEEAQRRTTIGAATPATVATPRGSLPHGQQIGLATPAAAPPRSEGCTC